MRRKRRKEVNKMKVKVEFVVETTGLGKVSFFLNSSPGKEEFKKEIEALIKDIDPEIELLSFDMYEKK